MWYVGMAVHQGSTTACVLDVQGKCLKQQTIERPRVEAAKWVQALGHRRKSVSLSNLGPSKRNDTCPPREVVEAPMKAGEYHWSKEVAP